MSNVIAFPRVNNAACSGRSMPGLTTPELRLRALDNFYTAERRAGADALTAYNRMCAFGDELDRIAAQVEASRYDGVVLSITDIMGTVHD